MPDKEIRHPTNLAHQFLSQELQQTQTVLKNRDITLPTKVCTVKAMIFPVVMYGCESWTVKKAECQRIV